MQTQMVNFVIPREFLVRVDDFARQTGQSRSEFFREAIRRYFTEEKEKERDFLTIKKAAGRIGLEEERATAMVDKVRKELALNQ